MFVPGKLFQPSQMFVGEPRTYPSEVPFRWYTLGKVPCLTYKDSTSFERLAKEKHSSLLRKFVNNGRKFFITLGPERIFQMIRDYGKLTIVIVKQYSSNNNIYIQILIQSTGYLPRPTLLIFSTIIQPVSSEDRQKGWQTRLSMTDKTRQT